MALFLSKLSDQAVKARSVLEPTATIHITINSPLIRFQFIPLRGAISTLTSVILTGVILFVMAVKKLFGSNPLWTSGMIGVCI